MSADRHHLDPAPFENRGRRPSVVYAYVDGDGTPVGAVARFEATTPAGKKSFSQYRLEDGRYVAGLAGRQLPLYRIDTLVAAVQTSATIWIAEGERCVDALVQRGLVATTNAGGAGKWNPEYAEHLRGAHVVTLADSDGPGREHAHGVAASLHGIAASVRVLELPASAEGDDIADWFERGGTAELLGPLAASAPLWEPARATASESWPTPLPFGASTSPEPFPLERALPESLRELAHAVAEDVHVDIAAPAALLPAIYSGAAGNAFEVQVSPNYSEPNLSRYTVVEQASGERKSALFRRISAPLVSWVSRSMESYRNAQRAYDDLIEISERERDEEIKARAKKKFHGPLAARGPEPKRPRFPLAPLSDITSPELVRQMHANGGAVAIASADARHVVDALLGQHRADGQTDDTVYLRAHGGDAIDRARVGSAMKASELVHIARPALALALTVQPDKVRLLAARKELIWSGLIPRINFCAPPSLVGTRIETGLEQPIDPSILTWFESSICDISDLRFKVIDAGEDGRFVPIRLSLSPEAMELRRAFANEFEERLGPGKQLYEVQAFGSKVAGEAARLAALFHLNEVARQCNLDSVASIPIDANLWSIAEAHQRWQFQETLRALSVAAEGAGEQLARRLLEWAASRTKPASAVTARQAIGDRRVESAAEFETGMQFLKERGWARLVAPAGREQAPRWIFHPAVHGGGA